MVDRLGDLRKASGNVAVSNRDVEIAVESNSYSSESDDGPDFMPDFFDEVAHIKAQMALMQDNIEDIRVKQGKAITATNRDDAAKLSDELEDLVSETNRAAGDIRARLKSMEAANKAFTASNAGTAEERIRTSTYSTITRKFVEVMGEYNEVQTAYKEKCEDRIDRVARISHPKGDDATEEDIAAWKKEGEMFGLQSVQVHAGASQALENISERHQDIIKLEQSIMELHQMFVDMAILVEAQGELLDQIEYNVSKSVGYTEKAVSELHKAGESQKSYRNKLCCLLVFFVVVLAAILGPVLSSAGKSA